MLPIIFRCRTDNADEEVAELIADLGKHPEKADSYNWKKLDSYRWIAVESDLRPKVQVDIVVSAIPVRDVIETAKKVLYTGHIGDGKIFVYDVENVVKVRTGEEGYDALQDVE